MKPIILSFAVLLFFRACPSDSSTGTGPVPDFQAEVLDDQVQIGYGLAIGDVDGDAKPDILLADKKQIVWYRNGDWQRFVMAEDLTERDNVCLTARDINGDGKVEVAVGAQWNPGETIDSTQSGAVFYLIRPDDPTGLWEPVALPHEPTVHRMHWVKVGDHFELVVLPLHGRNNKSGEGPAVKMLAYRPPADPHEAWTITTADESMHMTHNFEVVEMDGGEGLLVGGKEGAKLLSASSSGWSVKAVSDWQIRGDGFGEIRKSGDLIAGIQPMHGHELVAYPAGAAAKILTDSLNQGHALAIGDLIGQGHDQIVAGWRDANEAGETGIKLFVSQDPSWNTWQSFWIDRNGMACEDLKLADLNGDGKLDIIAAGRATKNLKVYWNGG